MTKHLTKKTPYKICKRCVMDTTDPEITFDDQGYCKHCTGYFEFQAKMELEKPRFKAKLEGVISQIKEKGKGKPYDCIIGISGGVDSTYVAYAVKKLGLRPLAIHLDNGWDSELAVSNIEKALKNLDIDLFTYVIDWNEFRDLQMSFLKASTPGMEIPTDHAIISILSQMASKYNIEYIINGSNASSEYIMPNMWSEGMGQRDWLLIKNVQKQFGTKKLKSFPHTSLFDYGYYKLVKKQKIINILNYIDYNKTAAKETIEKELGWVYYGGKHYESIYTRFTQAYIQPLKFDIDKRKPHLSNQICSGELTREEVLKDLEGSAYPSKQMEEDDYHYFLKKMNLSEEEFQEILALPTKSFLDYQGYYNHPIYKTIRTWAFKIHFFLKKTWVYGNHMDE